MKNTHNKQEHQTATFFNGQNNIWQWISGGFSMAAERPWAKVMPKSGATLSPEKAKIYVGYKTAKIFLSLLNNHAYVVNS